MPVVIILALAVGSMVYLSYFVFFFSSRRRHTRFDCDWSSDVCSSDLIGTAEKVAVIFIGTFFQLVLLVADVSANVSKDLLDSAYTLGAKRGTVFSRVLVPATLPGVMDNLRITMGWAWTYLIVAELVAADRGLGYLILDSMRGLYTDRIFVGLFVIGLLGLGFDIIFKRLHRILLPWSPKI